MDCAVSSDLGRYQAQLDREARQERMIEREAQRLAAGTVTQLIAAAPDDLGRQVDELLTEIAARIVESENEPPEPTDADDCRQMMALQKMRRCGL